MGHAVRDGGGRVCRHDVPVGAVHRLQPEVAEGEAVEAGRMRGGFTLGVDELELVARREPERRASLGAHADPVDPGRGGLRAVGFDGDLEADGVQRVDGEGVELEQGFAAGTDDERGHPIRARLAGRAPRARAPPIGNRERERVGVGESTAVRANPDKIGVAELADRTMPVRLAPRPEIAPREAAEDGRAPGVRALALQRVEEFLDGIHRALLPRDRARDNAGRVARRVRDADLLESLAAEQARVAVAARAAVGGGIVARGRRTVFHTQCGADADGLGFRQMQQRRAEPERHLAAGGGFDARTRGQIGHALERLDVLGAAVRIAGVVDGRDAEIDVARPSRFGERKRVREEDGVARWDVGDRDLVRGHRLVGAVLGHRDVGGERRPAEGAQIDVDDHVACNARGGGDPARGVDLVRVALAVAKAECVDREPVALRDRETGSRVETAGQEDDGGRSSGYGRHARKVRRPCGPVVATSPRMAALTDPSLWLGLLTLSALEIVLGIDNIIFLSILAGKLPQEEQATGRRLGLAMAFVTRVLLLLSISWLARLTAPLFTMSALSFLELEAREVSGRDLILILGGLFLIGKSTYEIHHKLESSDESHASGPARRTASLAAVVAQIAVVDIVFSLDSVITAVGMVNNIAVMIGANVIALGFMLGASGAIATFVDRHPTIKMLALSFLVLIGTNLVAEGFGQHIPKGYTYFAMFFSVGVELLNLRARRSAEAAPITLRAGGTVEQALVGEE